MSHHILRCLILLPLLAYTSPSTAERTFRWVDENGQVHYGDRVPPEYANKERLQLDDQGRTIKVYEAPKTPEEKAEAQRLAVIETARKKIAEKRLRRDRTLLATYSSEEDMLQARDGKVASVDSLIQLTHQRIRSMQKRLLELTDDAAEYERSGKKLPVGLQQQISNIREQITQNENFVKDKQLEIEGIRRQFDADIARFQELTSDKQQATAAAVPDLDEVERELEAEEKQPPPAPVVSRAPRKQRPDIELSRSDRTLLATYTNEAALLDARDDKLASINAGIRETATTIDSLQSRLSDLVDNADEYEKAGNTPPETLLNQMQGVLDDITRNEGIMEARRRDKREVERQFEEDLDRYREITVEN